MQGLALGAKGCYMNYAESNDYNTIANNKSKKIWSAWTRYIQVSQGFPTNLFLPISGK